MSNSSEQAGHALVLNWGSSSLKAAIYADVPDIDTENVIRPLATASIEPRQCRNVGAVSEAESLVDSVIGVFPLLRDAPSRVGHRIVHGAGRVGPVALTPHAVEQLQTLSSLAPLHQAASLSLVDAAARRWPDAQQVGVFDTSWHRTMPARHQVLPLPRHLHACGVQRFGFHGLAFQSALRQLAHTEPAVARGRVVLAHLGGGSSVCAARAGCSVNTTMGMTPLGGVPMATRSGSLDPGVLLYLQRLHGMAEPEIDSLLWHESGMKGLSGESGDMRVLLGSSSADARLAIDVYVSSVAQAIAAMAACIDGVDALVFSGGIGANSPVVRARVVAQLGWLGLQVDTQSNAMGCSRISRDGASVQVHVFHVDEQSEIHRSMYGA